MKHLKGEDTNKKLLELLNDPSIYLKKYRSKDSRDNNVKQKLDKIYNKVIENINDYISITGRSLDFNKISNVFDISQANAKTIKNEILKSEEFKEHKKKMEKKSDFLVWIWV